jgi:hypothetical protein
VNIRYVQRLLGHARLSTTEIYTRVSDVALRLKLTEANVIDDLPQPLTLNHLVRPPEYLPLVGRQPQRLSSYFPEDEKATIDRDESTCLDHREPHTLADGSTLIALSLETLAVDWTALGPGTPNRLLELTPKVARQILTLAKWVSLM